MGIANISVGLAFLAGLASFLSPCVFSLVPAYIGYLGGRTVAASQNNKAADRWTAVSHGLAFVLGFSVVFVLLGVAASALGGLLYNAAHDHRQSGRDRGSYFWLAYDRNIEDSIFGVRFTAAIDTGPQPRVPGFSADGSVLFGWLVAVRGPGAGSDPDAGAERRICLAGSDAIERLFGRVWQFRSWWQLLGSAG